MTYTTKLLKVGKVAGMFYKNNISTDTLVIYGIGAPLVPDSGSLPDAPIILSFKTDLFVPDYIGYGRSDGRCTPKNCIKTFLLLYDAFIKGCTAVNSYENYSTHLQYKRIIFIGRSFGGTYIPLLPRFNPHITELGLIYPATDNVSCGSMPNEESNEDFMRAMSQDGYKYLYRGILSPVWIDHLQNKDGFAPIDNVQFLKNAKVFIGHGKRDICINYAQSVKYFKKIQKTFPLQTDQYVLKLYPKTGHTSATSHQAVHDFLTWLQVKPR